MIEKWKECKDNLIPYGQYEIIEICQNMEGTALVLESENVRVIIKFGFVDAIRSCDEGRRIKTYNEIDELQRYRKDFMGCPLYLIENSQFCKWIIEESAGFCIDSLHYAIVTINDIVDVVSSVPPEIIVSDN